jgi:hypothetical protein
MTDYYPLLKRAVDGLEKSTGEARRSLYERARNALVDQLRGMTPPLNEAEITRERLALEEAVRKVEAEAARRLREPPPAAPPAPPQPEAPRQRPPPPGPPPARLPDAPGVPVPPPAAPLRNRMEGERPPLQSEGLKGFRDVVAEAETLGEATASASRSAREAFAAAAPSPTGELERLEPRVEPAGLRPPARPPAPPRGPEPAGPPGPPEPPGPARRRPPPGPPARRTARDEHGDRGDPGRRGLIAAIAAVVVLALLAGTAYWQRERISSLFGVVRGLAPQTPRDAGQPRPKIADRVGQEAQPDQSRPGAPGARPGQAGPAVAQRVVLYEEDPSNPEGNRYAGSALWRTETVSPGPGQAPELAIRVDVEIPDRRLAMTMSIRRNTDTTLPATHTVEIVFNLPSDFAFGGVASVPGLLVKESEQMRGAPLSGLAVKVTNNFFLIGLSAVEADLQRNLTLLKERAWFDIPVVYNNGRRAILAIEKGNPGERVFNDAFTTWKQ